MEREHPVSRRASLPALVEEKRRVAEELRELLGPRRARRAESDHHARRRPRHCGMTIHTGVGCSYGCVYCYIWDMGFPGRPRPYPLEPLEMAYALAVNPYVLPRSTMAAYGSVTEPFLPETRERALGYIGEVYRWLRLPTQVSTKAVVDEGLARELAAREPRLSVLVSVTAVGEWARRLEPRAPPAEERIAAAGEAARRGLSVALFLRPIIPGVTDVQARRILEMAWDAGIRDLVPGSLRVTPGILSRLEAAGVPRRALEARLPRRPRGPRDQVTLREEDIKARIVAEAREMGFRVHPSACSHNMWSHGTPCHACRLGPCGPGRPAPPSPEEVAEAVEALGGSARLVEVRYPVIVVRGLRGVRPDVVKEVLEAATKLQVRVER